MSAYQPCRTAKKTVDTLEDVRYQRRMNCPEVHLNHLLAQREAKSRGRRCKPRQRGQNDAVSSWLLRLLLGFVHTERATVCRNAKGEPAK